MSEIKRANLIAFGGDREDDKRKPKAAVKSVRLAFVLPESTESTCPVYNFKEELAAAKKKEKLKIANGKSVPTNGLDPFDEDDDDVKRIAMEMEAKYGTGPPTKKKHKGRRDDYADIGMGYDESDSFIDNTDGYDEMIPQNVTTLHGGFYINCGALEFKTDEGASSEGSSSSSLGSSSDEEDNDADGGKKSARRKRVLDTSDSDEDAETERGERSQPEKKQRRDSVNGVLTKKKKDAGDLNANVKMARKVEEKKKVVKEKRDEVGIADTKVVLAAAASPESPPESGLPPGPATSSSEGENSREAMAAGGGNPSPIVPAIILPENLPQNIVDLLNNIKESALANEKANAKLISGDVKTLLITFERKSKVLGKQSRSKIYHHLAPILKCKKDSLCRRAKTLVMDEDSRRLKHLLVEMKAKVEIAMGTFQTHYDKECERVNQLKGQLPEDPKAGRLPKRRFLWSDETRKTFREILIVKKRLLIYEGKNKEAIEIHLNLFIKSDIQTIWPDGWMSMAALFKLSNSFDKKFNQSSSSSTLSSPRPPQPPPPTVAPRPPVPTPKPAPIPKTVTTPSFTISAITSGLDAQPKNIPKGNDLIIEPISTTSSSISTSQHKIKSVEKTTKFINLSRSEGVPENLSVKPPRPPTDHKIENIMKPNPPKCSDKDVKVKAFSEVVPKEELGSTSASSILTKIPIENFMPKPRILPEVKREEEDDVIVLEDSSPEIFPDKPSEQLMSPPSSDYKRSPKNKPKFKALAAYNATSKSASVNSKSIGRGGGSENNKHYASKKDAKSHEGDDIQQVMENLKVLQKMSTPSKSNEVVSPSSAVSVIAFNKNYSKTANSASSSASPTTKMSAAQEQAAKVAAEYNNMSYHDVYQRQFLSDFKTLATSAAATTSKNFSSNSAPSSLQADKLYTNANNNYTTTQNSLKYKSFPQPPHSGSFNLMDDMLANFLTEYGYPKAANHKTKPSQK